MFKKKFAEGGLVAAAKNDKQKVLISRGWLKCKRCGSVFESSTDPPLNHFCPLLNKGHNKTEYSTIRNNIMPENMETPWGKYIHEAIRTMQHAVHQNALDHGWYVKERSDAELIALEHSELSEALEALRHGNKESEKIPGFSKAEEELADAVIRIADHCGYRGCNLAGAILAKHEYNKTRPHRHGGKLF